METAAFQLKNYQFISVTLDNNLLQNNDINIGFEVSGKFLNKTEEENSKFELIFSTSANCKDIEAPFVNVICKGEFIFDGVSSITDIPDFFYQNSIAILFPYVRAYISLITTQANVDPIILPTLNLSSLSSLLKNNSK